uniref:Uncharacterized protein n=1 Tax=Oryza sativa subsp. japonica TaxID=39947 RepID=Q9FVY4_ORYSJ|nr:unknown protein [Oryza sativa Japonica Group]
MAEVAPPAPAPEPTKDIAEERAAVPAPEESKAMTVVDDSTMKSESFLLVFECYPLNVSCLHKEIRSPDDGRHGEEDIADQGVGGERKGQGRQQVSNTNSSSSLTSCQG